MVGRVQMEISAASDLKVIAQDLTGLEAGDSAASVEIRRGINLAARGLAMIGHDLSVGDSAPSVETKMATGLGASVPAMIGHPLTAHARMETSVVTGLPAIARDLTDRKGDCAPSVEVRTATDLAAQVDARIEVEMIVQGGVEISELTAIGLVTIGVAMTVRASIATSGAAIDLRMHALVTIEIAMTVLAQIATRRAATDLATIGLKASALGTTSAVSALATIGPARIEISAAPKVSVLAMIDLGMIGRAQMEMTDLKASVRVHLVAQVPQGAHPIAADRVMEIADPHGISDARTGGRGTTLLFLQGLNHALMSPRLPFLMTM